MKNSGGPLGNQLGREMAGRNKSFQSLVFVLTQLHLTFQCPTRIFTFSYCAWLWNWLLVFKNVCPLTPVSFTGNSRGLNFPLSEIIPAPVLKQQVWRILPLRLRQDDWCTSRNQSHHYCADDRVDSCQESGKGESYQTGKRRQTRNHSGRP